MSNSLFNSPFNLENKTAIITGGASGIGAATAELFASVGATVHVSDIDLKACQDRHASSEFADKIIVHHCDVADKASVDATVSESSILLNGAKDVPDILYPYLCAGFAVAMPFSGFLLSVVRTQQVRR